MPRGSKSFTASRLLNESQDLQPCIEGDLTSLDIAREIHALVRDVYELPRKLLCMDLAQVLQPFYLASRASFHAPCSAAADACLPHTPAGITGKDTILLNFPWQDPDPGYVKRHIEDPRTEANRENNLAASRNGISKAQ